jgi:hypothetical protein
MVGELTMNLCFTKKSQVCEPTKASAKKPYLSKWLSTIDLLIKVACFVKMQIMFALSKTADQNYLVQGGQLY